MTSQVARQKSEYHLCIEWFYELSLLFVFLENDVPDEWQWLEVQGPKQKRGGIEDLPMQYLS